MNVHRAVGRTPLVAIVLGAAIAIATLMVVVVSSAGAQASRTGDTTPKPSGDASAASGLTTDDLSGTLTPTDLVNDFVGSGVTVSDVTYTGPDVAAGKFGGGNGIIGFDEGFILSSGKVANVAGPNQVEDKTADNGTAGDPDLNSLAGFPTHDASVLEFNFVPNSSAVSFKYVFTSEEYNEYVNSEFNDVFGFFVNGTNCAEVQGDPVSINTINNGTTGPYPPGVSHPELYINNDLASGHALDTEMDGLTTVLTCTASVTAGQENHIKLAIADSSDPILDSNVFLKKGSFVTISAGGPYDVDEGSSVDVSASGGSSEGGALTFAWDLDNDGTFETPGQDLDNDGSLDDATFDASNIDGLNPPTAKTIKVKAIDPQGAAATAEATVNVNNVAPTITSISNPLQALANTAVSFNASVTDPSPADTSAGFLYQWALDGGAFASGSNPFSTTFSSCGDHYVTAKAQDDDGGVSDPKTSSVVSVSEAHFRPPLDEGVYNTVQKVPASSKTGRVIPVKISIGCGGANLTGLSPAIQLLKGDKTDGSATGTDAIETFSSSTADTTGFMRSVDGGYIYNLEIPKSAAAGDVLTIRVRPFGDSNPDASMYVVLQVK